MRYIITVKDMSFPNLDVTYNEYTFDEMCLQLKSHRATKPAWAFDARLFSAINNNSPEHTILPLFDKGPVVALTIGSVTEQVYGKGLRVTVGIAGKSYV